MGTIDADAHVIETERTWDYLSAAEQAFRPRVVHTTEAVGAETAWWMIDGRLQPLMNNIGKDTAAESRELSDVSARLKHMDALGVDVQVLYPTVFLRPLTRRPDVALGLARSYNRWLADLTSQAPDRLKWVATIPTQDMDAALTEIQEARRQGACGVFVCGLESERRLSDPYFYPLYETAQDLDIPVCIHSGNNAFQVHDFYDDEPGFSKFKLATIGAFHHLIFNDVPARFPRLRVGFIEVSAQWVPYVLHDMAKRIRRTGRTLAANPLREYRIWVACQTDDDLDYILKYADEEFLLIGTDYGHADTSSEIEALRQLRADGKVSATVIDKILDANPRAFYGLPAAAH